MMLGVMPWHVATQRKEINDLLVRMDDVFAERRKSQKDLMVAVNKLNGSMQRLKSLLPVVEEGEDG